MKILFPILITVFYFFSATSTLLYSGDSRDDALKKVMSQGAGAGGLPASIATGAGIR